MGLKSFLPHVSFEREEIEDIMWSKQESTHTCMAASHRHETLLDQGALHGTCETVREPLSEVARNNSPFPVPYPPVGSSLIHLESKTPMNAKW